MYLFLGCGAWVSYLPFHLIPVLDSPSPFLSVFLSISISLPQSSSFENRSSFIKPQRERSRALFECVSEEERDNLAIVLVFGCCPHFVFFDSFHFILFYFVSHCACA